MVQVSDVGGKAVKEKPENRHHVYFEVDTVFTCVILTSL